MSVVRIGDSIRIRFLSTLNILKGFFLGRVHKFPTIFDTVNHLKITKILINLKTDSKDEKRQIATIYSHR